MMNRWRAFLGFFILMALATVGPVLGAGPAVTVIEGCKNEIETKCKDVNPGDGRVLACLYAYQDQLSGQCEYALYDAALRLQQAIAALALVASECSEEIQKNCAGVQVGEGRILSCLKEHDSDISKNCKQAIKDVGGE